MDAVDKPDLNTQNLPDVLKLGHNKLQLENEKLIDEIKIHKIKIQDLSSDIENITKEKTLMVEMAEKQRNIINSLQYENTSLTTNNNEYKTSLSNEKNTHENIKKHLQSEIEKMNSINEQHILTQKNLQSYIDDLINKNNDLKQKYIQMSSSHTEKVNELEFKKKEVIHLQNELNTICNHNKTLHEELNVTKIHIDNHAKQIKDLNEQNILLQQQIQQREIHEREIQLQRMQTPRTITATGNRGLKTSSRR